MVGEADLVADDVARRRAKLLGDATRHGARGDPSRLRVTDQAAHPPPLLEADLGELRRLAGTRLAADDDHLMLANRGTDLRGAFADRQLRWIGDIRSPRCARARDRKSTRLNSSHVEISYAVFCLKKKKKAGTRRAATWLPEKVPPKS